MVTVTRQWNLHDFLGFDDGKLRVTRHDRVVVVCSVPDACVSASRVGQ